MTRARVWMPAVTACAGRMVAIPPLSAAAPAMSREGVMTDSPKFSPLGLTFDDVLLLPAHSELMPSEADTGTRITRGYRLRIPLVSSPWIPSPRPDGDRDGAPGGRRSAAPQPVHRGAGPAGRPGEAVRSRDGHRPGDLRPRRDDRRRGAALRQVPDLGCPRYQRRRHSPRHRHEPRHQVRSRPFTAGSRGDDGDAAGHRRRGGAARGGAAAAQAAQGGKAAARRRQLAGCAG